MLGLGQLGDKCPVEKIYAGYTGSRSSVARDRMGEKLFTSEL
jgi:hypothetical protein